MKVDKTFVSSTALRAAEDPDAILVCENWIDRKNFMSLQLKRPYRDRYEARLPELLRSPANCPSSTRSAPCHSHCGDRRSHPTSD
jgi:quinol monooxygenase YgiN